MQTKADSPPTSAPQLLTVGRMAELLNIPRYRLTYLIDTRADIQPCARAGNVRLFDRQALARLRYEIARIEARRASKPTADDPRQRRLFNNE